MLWFGGVAVMVLSQAGWQPEVKDECLNPSRRQELVKAEVDHQSQPSSHEKVLPDPGAESNYLPDRRW